jgi:hypothetical protein
MTHDDPGDAGPVQSADLGNGAVGAGDGAGGLIICGGRPP